jgi:hypothetical protein
MNSSTIEQGCTGCTIAGTTQFVSAKFANGLDLTSSQLFNLTRTGVDAVSDSISVVGWIKQVDGATKGSFAAAVNALNQNTAGWMLQRSGTANSLYVRVDTNLQVNAGCGFNGLVTALDGTWHQVAFTLSNGSINFYMDGMLKHTCSFRQGTGFASNFPLQLQATEPKSSLFDGTAPPSTSLGNSDSGRPVKLRV